MKVGFIGLGIMGSRMALHIRQHDYEVVLFNRTPEKAAALLQQGASWAETPSAVAEQVDILFTMLADPDAVTATALGPDGFLEALSPDALWVDCSTTHPAFTRRMADAARQRQVHFLEAPVAGSKPQAARAELVFIAGGAHEDVETARPFFERMGKKVLHVGVVGQGTSLKLVLNHLLATSMAAFAEGMALGQSLGLDRDLLFDVLLGGPVVAPFVAMKREKMTSGNYDADFPLQWMHKDLQMVSTTAFDTGVAMPLSHAAKEVYALAQQQGAGRDDFAAIYRFLSTTHPS